MYNGIGDFLEEDLAEMGQELDEMLASTATNLSQLNTLIQ